MWAYVESMGFGPEEADCRPWVVYSYSSASWEEQTGVQVVSLDAPATEEEGKKQGVEFDLVLDIEFSAILQDVDGFKQDVVRDLVLAVGAQSDKIRVLGLEAGSVIVRVIFDEGVCGDIRSALDALREIERQAANPMSVLRQGQYTSHVKSLRVHESTLRHLKPASRRSSQRRAEEGIVEALRSKPKTPRAPGMHAESPDEPRWEISASLRAKPSVISWFLHKPSSVKLKWVPPRFIYNNNFHAHRAALDQNNDGVGDEGEQSVGYGASHVRISGLVLYQGGSAQPYTGINGEYRRSDDVCNGRAVYSKEDKPSTVMWWANTEGNMSWCVGCFGPKDAVGDEGMWAYVKSMGFGPEEAGRRAWNVFSYNSGSWEEQTGVQVENLDLPQTQTQRAQMPEKTLDTLYSELDRDGDGKIDDFEFREYLSTLQGVLYGASHVRISGVVLHQGDSERPYTGINGEYRRSDEACNGRAVYFKENKPSVAMWLTNNDGKISWCVGPREEVGGDGMWAYVESMGSGPEEAETRAWNVYSYNSGSWEEQTGVEVENLDPPEVEATEDGDDLDSVIEEEDANEDFDAAVAQAEARRTSAHRFSRPNTGSLRQPRSRPLTARSSLRPSTGSRSRPMTGSRSRPPTGGCQGLCGRPLTPLEVKVEDALLKQVSSRPQSPVAPSDPAQSDKRHKLDRNKTPPTSANTVKTPPTSGTRPSTAARLLEKQKAAAAAVAAEKERMGISDAVGDSLRPLTGSRSRPMTGIRSRPPTGGSGGRKKMEDAAAAQRKRLEQQDLETHRQASALKLQSVLRGHKGRRWFSLQRRMFTLPGQRRTMAFEHKFPSSVTWKLPRARGLAIDQGLWNTPWRMLQGADWRDPQKHTPDLTVLRHKELGTVIELKHAAGSGKSFVFKETSVGTRGTTPRNASKVKICREDTYVADWRFNAATLVKRMEAGEGSKIPCGPISFGCWHFKQTDPAVVCEDVFRKLDKDGSGAMEADEVYEAAQIMGFTDMSEDVVKAWIEEHDEDGNGLIDSEEFKTLIGADKATKNMKVTSGESTSELWLTSEGFVMLGHENKNQAIICIGGKLLPYAVPKTTAWMHLGRADEAMKRTEFAAQEAAKKAAAEEARRQAGLVEEMARMKKVNDKLAQIERRRQSEAEAHANRKNVAPA
jgi:Ca2+-binding EF-hand superfamily protein